MNEYIYMSYWAFAQQPIARVIYRRILAYALFACIKQQNRHTWRFCYVELFGDIRNKFVSIDDEHGAGCALHLVLWFGNGGPD